MMRDNITRFIYYYAFGLSILLLPLKLTSEEMKQLWEEEKNRPDTIERQSRTTQMVYIFLGIVGVLSGIILMGFLLILKLSLNLTVPAVGLAAITSFSGGLVILALYFIFRSYPVFLAGRTKKAKLPGKKKYVFLDIEYLIGYPISVIASYFLALTLLSH